MSEIQNARVHNWYIRKGQGVYFLSGDRLDARENRKKFHHYVILSVVKELVAGYKFEVIDEFGGIETVACRFDQKDRYFLKRKHQFDIQYTSAEGKSALSEFSILHLYDKVVPFNEEVNPADIIDLQPIKEEVTPTKEEATSIKEDAAPTVEEVKSTQ